MKLYFPDNIFTRLLAENLPSAVQKNIVFTASSIIPGELKNSTENAGLITPTDLLTLPDIFISSKTGISFEGVLSNSYVYFNPGEKDLRTIYVHGDITSLEVILSKILFKENYDSDVKIEILADISKAEGKTILVAGDQNFKQLDFNSGLSFADEMVDLLSLPYVNFIFASYNEKSVSDFNTVSKGVSTKIYGKVEKGNFGTDLSDDAKLFIKENVSSLIYEFENQDIDDIHQLIRLPYFYGIINDMIEPRFV